MLVCNRLRQLLASQQELLPLLASIASRTDSAGAVADFLRLAERLSACWDRQSPTELRELLLRLLDRVGVDAERIHLHVRTDQVPTVLGGDLTAAPTGSISTDSSRPCHVIAIPARLRRAGIEMALVVGGATQPISIDPVLVRLLARAHALRDRLLAETSGTLEHFAAREGVTPSWVTRVVRLAYLAPDIVASIMEGRQPTGFTANRLLQDTRLPIGWAEQRTRLGFG